MTAEVNRRVLHPLGLALERSSGWEEHDVAQILDEMGWGPEIAAVWEFVQRIGLDRRGQPQTVTPSKRSSTRDPLHREQIPRIRPSWYTRGRRSTSGTDDGWSPWGRWYHLRRIRLSDVLEPLGAPRGGIRYIDAPRSVP